MESKNKGVSHKTGILRSRQEQAIQNAPLDLNNIQFDKTIDS